MFIYIIQTIFLLLIAFALGGLVGYLLKRYFGCPADLQNDTAAADRDVSSAHLATSQTSVSSQEMSTDTPAGGLTASTNEHTSSDENVDSMAAEDAKTKRASTPSAPKTSTKAKTTTTAKKAASSTKKASATKLATKPVGGVSKSAVKKPAAAAAVGHDDLKQIKGVGKLNETRLNEAGITSFAQVAAWKKADIAAFDEKLNFKGRIEREEWVPQAKALAKQATKTATEKKDAANKITAKKTTAKKATGKKAPTKKAAPAKPDDLKLIKGVGKLIETKLAKEGITQFSQIAAWKKADIADFDEKLSFKGRIERDEWVSQAKILAKSGPTEFSKRASKGEVSSSS